MTGPPGSGSGSRNPSRYRLRHRDREVEVPIGGLLVGRAPGCDLRLSSGLVSRHHARLSVTAEGVLLEDLGSRNGVLVNDRKLSGPRSLTHGDVIRVGIETFELVDEGVRERPANLSTLPAPALTGVAPSGEADVDSLEDTLNLDVLSERELQVLKLLVYGNTQREIAQQLFITVKTVEKHRSRIAEKLGCATRSELVAYAISAGILQAGAPR